jgi:hypothetical protein
MTSLGRALVFYLQYEPEMAYLTRPTEPDVSRLPGDTRVILDMADAVAKKAQEDAAAFVQACELTLTPCIGRVADIISRKPDAKNWRISWTIGLPNRSALLPIQFWIGIAPQRREILLSIWHGGGRSGEERARRLLGARAVASSAEWAGDSGGVALAMIPVTAGRNEDFEVDRDAILTQLAAAVTSITEDDLQALQQIRTGSSRTKDREQ